MSLGVDCLVLWAGCRLFSVCGRGFDRLGFVGGASIYYCLWARLRLPLLLANHFSPLSVESFFEVVRVGVTVFRYVSLDNAAPWLINIHKNMKGRGVICGDEVSSLETYLSQILALFKDLTVLFIVYSS